MDRLLADNVWNAVVIFRVLRVRRATVRFETDPGRQLQSDWGEHRTWTAGAETTIHFPVNTLGVLTTALFLVHGPRGCGAHL